VAFPACFHGSAHAPYWVNAVRTGSAELMPTRGHRGPGYDTWLYPMAGRVYVTPWIFTALRYAKSQSYHLGYQSGVVLDVMVPDGASVLPDEDCLGEILGYAFGMDGRTICEWHDHEDVYFDKPRLARLRRKFAQYIPFDVAWYETNPDLRVLVRAAKHVMPYVDQETIDLLIMLGANLAVSPPVHVVGCWIIDPTFELPPYDGPIPFIDPVTGYELWFPPPRSFNEAVGSEDAEWIVTHMQYVRNPRYA